MPIRPEHRKHYGPKSGWPQLRLRLLARAGGRCEQCGVKNHTHGWRDERGAFHEVHTDGEHAEAAADARRVIRIVLTVAHLDHDGHTGARDESRLRVLCQFHHNWLDAHQRAANASHTRAIKLADPAQQRLFQ